MSSSKTTKTENEPWAPAQPYLKEALAGAEQAYNTTYNGSSVAPQNDWTKQGLAQGAANAQAGTTTNLANQVGAHYGDVLGNGGLSAEQSLAAGGMMRSLGQAGMGQRMAGNTLANYASGGMMGQNPYLKQTVGTAMQDAADSINSQFSGAGRYGSGAHGRVLSDRLGNIATNAYMQDYNQQQQNQLNAANSLGGLANSSLGANTSALGALGNIGQQGITNTGQIGQSLGDLNTAQNLDALNLASLGGQQQAYDQSVIDAANSDPWTKASNLAQIASGMGVLGGTSTSTTRGSSGIGGVFGGLLGGLGALKNLGGLGGIGSLFTLSDERAKEDIQPVGKLADGQKVYSYTYKGDPERTPQIGLLAQEVEEREPDAVAEVGGVKMVNYAKATEKAAKLARKKGLH